MSVAIAAGGISSFVDLLAAIQLASPALAKSFPLIAGIGKVFTGLKTAIVAHPYIAAAAAITAFAIAVARLGKATKEARIEALQRNIDLGANAAKEFASIRELYETYKIADDQYKIDSSNKEAYVEATNNLIDALGAEGYAVRDLADDFYNLSDAMDEAVRKKLLDNIYKEVDGINAQRRKLTEEWGEGTDFTYSPAKWASSDGSVLDSAYFAGADQKIYPTVKEAIGDYYSERSLHTYGSSSIEGEYFAFKGNPEKVYKDALKVIELMHAGVEEGTWTAQEMAWSKLYNYAVYTRDRLESSVGELTDSISAVNKQLVEYQYNDFVNQSKGKLPKTLDEFKTFRKELVDKTIGSGLFQGSDSEVAKAIDAYLETQNGFENFYGIPRFKEEIKSLSSDTLKYLKNGGEATQKMRDELTKFLDANEYSPEQFTNLFEEISDSIDDSGNILEQTTSQQIKDLTSFRDELEITAKALEKYKAATEGGDKGDALAEMANIRKSAIEDYEAGKIDTYSMRAAADLFFDRDFLANNNIGLDQVGELLSSGIWEAVFASDDYTNNLVDYLQGHASEFGDAVKVATDAAGNIQFAYKSVSSLAQALGVSESAAVAFLDALDAMGVQAMMSGEDMGELVDKLDLIPGEVKKNSEKIPQIIESLASDGLDYWDIQGSLKSLESAGLIDTSGIQNLGQMINEATQGLEDLGNKEETPTVDVVDNASGTLERVKSLLDGIEGRNVSASVTVSVAMAGALAGFGGIDTASVHSIGGFASGTNNAPKGKAFVNELGPEIVIQDGVAKEFNDGKPALINLNRGDIVLPADVTADAKRNGHKAKKFGSARFGFGTITNRSTEKVAMVTLDGNGETVRQVIPTYQTTLDKPDDNSSGNGPGNTSSDSGKKQKIDWIEVAIDRIESTISKFRKTIDSTFKSLGKRLSASKSAISEITKEIELQQKAAERYMKEAESVGLSDDLAKLVREGTVDISEYDEETAKLINEYKQWYEKSLDCASAVDDLHESLGDLYRENFDAVQEDFENKISQIEHDANMLNTEMDKLEASGYLRSAKAYSSLANIESKNLSMLKSELAELQKYFEQAMKSGEIEEGSKSWYEMRSEIDGVKEAISESELQLIEFAKTIREINWENFDYAIGRISRLTEESEFLIGLLEDSKLFNDDGSFTNEGITSVGLRLQNYNTYMAQADQYAEELKRIDGELQKDPWNKDLIARREQLLDLQQQSITEANNEKRAAADLAKQGIQKQVEAMRDLIDEYSKSLDSAKDLYDYQKKVSKQTSTIADIQKQLAAYTNDSSEENRSRVQKLQKQLKEAEESLQETEYEHYISEQKKLMEDLYSDYEETVNSRLDDIDALIDDLIGATNASSDVICQTIERISAGVGYTPTDEMRSVWDGSSGTFSIVSKYGGSIDTKLTSIGQVISAILANVQAMVAASGMSVKQYKTGGLIDYTGIAKVDGTPSKPELVLDSSDTENLLAAINSVRGVNWAGISTTPTLSALRDMSRMFGRVNSGINQRALSGGIDNVEVNISIERVSDYNDFIAQLQRDKNAERIIKAIAEDAMFGGNSMGKYKVNVRN